MDQDYDVIVLGTGLKECIISGLLSVTKNKVLHMDRNNYYGGESASLNMEQLYEKFCPEQKIPEEMGRSRDYNIDLCPKFIMACGDLVKMLLLTKVTRYLDFKSVAGSFVLKDSTIHKVPATAKEALMSSLMGMFEKRRYRNFLNWVESFEEKDESTWKGVNWRGKMSEVFKHFKLDANTISFTGHACALYTNDAFLEEPALPTIKRIKLYAYSVSRYGNSPYIYPIWGLGGLPEGFSRLSAVYGGVYMLNKPIDRILYDAEGKVRGVESNGEVARCKKLVGDPSYFMGTDKIKKIGQVARCICVMSHPIPNTKDGDSCQIIVPGRQIPGRTNDVYISCVSSHHQIAAKGKYVAMISLQTETENPANEVRPLFKLLGKIDKSFFWVSDMYAPTGDGSKDNCFISSSYDATTHFETTTAEVLRLYELIQGRKLDLEISAEPEDLTAHLRGE